MAETLANEWSTTLAAAITSTSSTSISLTAAPPSTDLRVRIDDEYLLITASSGSGPYTVTVTRGVEGSTAATHSNGATVTHVLTAGGLTQFVNENAGSGGSSSVLDAAALDSTYGDEFEGPSLDAKWTRLGIDSGTESIADSWLRLTRRNNPTSGGEGYYQTPGAMPGYMELVFSGSFDASGTDAQSAGPYFVTSGGAGIAAGFTSTGVAGGSGLELWTLSGGIATGTQVGLSRPSANAVLSGAKHWIRLIRFVGDGATMFLAQFSLNGSTWSDFINLESTTAVTRIAFGRYHNGTGDFSQVLSVDRFNAIPMTPGNNLCRTPTSGTATYTASSTFSGYSAAAAFDGNHTNDWASNGYAANQYIQCAWSVAQSVNTILLRGRSSDTWAYGKIEFSDGSTVPVPYMTPTVNNCVLIQLPSTKSTTLLKVISTSGGATNPGFREIEAYNAS